VSQSTRLTDGRTDRRTDRQTDERTAFSSLDRVYIAYSAVKTDEQLSPEMVTKICEIRLKR